MKYKRYITLDSVKPILYYNKCYVCGSKNNLHECNNCIELYCKACDLLSYNWCSFCKYNYKNREKYNMYKSN